MSTNKVEADQVYDHSDYGEVLVCGIVQYYSTWSKENGGKKNKEAQVQFYDTFDDYGGMCPARTQAVSEFMAKADYLRSFEYIDLTQ